MPSSRRRLLLTEHDPVRMREAHNNLDDAVLKTEGRLTNGEDRLTGIDSDLVGLDERLVVVEDGVTALDAAAEAIADASVAHALNATFDDTEVEAALDALGTKVNAILAALRALA